jgi:ribosomal protein S3
VLAGTPESERQFAGLKVQLKGQINRSGGKASKKVWSTGVTGTQTFDDPVDFARMAAITRMGLVGIKVRGPGQESRGGSGDCEGV